LKRENHFVLVQKDLLEYEKKHEALIVKLINKRLDMLPKIQKKEEERQFHKKRKEEFQRQEIERYWNQLFRIIKSESFFKSDSSSVIPRWKIDVMQDPHGQRNRLVYCDDFNDIFSIDSKSLQLSKSFMKKNTTTLETTRLVSRALSKIPHKLINFNHSSEEKLLAVQMEDIDDNPIDTHDELVTSNSQSNLYMSTPHVRMNSVSNDDLSEHDDSRRNSSRAPLQSDNYGDKEDKEDYINDEEDDEETATNLENAFLDQTENAKHDEIILHHI
jgi:hypothetical protein